MKKIIISTSLVLLSFGLFGQIKTIYKGANRPNTVQADTDDQAWDKANYNDVYLNAAISLNNAALDSTEQIRIDVNSNTANITTNSTIFQDSLGWYNVLSYGAVGDSSSANATANRLAIQAAINASYHGSEITIPNGDYYIDSTITVNKDVKLKGSEWSFGTSLIMTRDFPIFRLPGLAEVGGQWPLGGEISGFTFIGSNDADSTNQAGIQIERLGKWLVERNFFYRLGGIGINYGESTGASGGTDINNNTFHSLWGQGIYGRSKEDTVINNVDIINNKFYNMHNHCVDLMAHQTIIHDNTFDANDSVGVYYNPLDVVGNCSSTANTIKYNWFENNKGGEIFIWHEYIDANGDRLNYNTVIEHNKFAVNATYDKPEATAMITIKEGPDATGGTRPYNLVIGRNHYVGDGPFVDLGAGGTGGVREDVSVWIQEQSDVAGDYLNMGNATKVFDGRDTHPIVDIGGVSVTGISEYNLHPVVGITYLNGNINITTNPQIADAEVDGYEMLIYNFDSDNITFDNGDGMILNGATSVVLGPNDCFPVMYSESEDSWIQTGPVSDN